METSMDNEMETGLIGRCIGSLCLTASAPGGSDYREHRVLYYRDKHR